MSAPDPLVAALKRLCEAEGGNVAVAEKARVSAANLYQIMAGVKSKAGRPRSVGTELREKLTKAYPHWLDEKPAAAKTMTGFTAQANELAVLFDLIPESETLARAAAWSAASKAIVDVVEGLTAKAKQPQKN